MVRRTFADQLATFLDDTGDPEVAAARQYVGLVCRYLREQAHLTQAELAEKINYTDLPIAHLEAGRRQGQPELWERMEEVLPSGLLAAAAKLLATVDHTRLRRAHPELDRESTALHCWAPYRVPDVLQTEDYARAMLRHQLPALTRTEVEQAVDIWRDQHAFLLGEDRPLLNIVLDETVLRRHVGGRDAMREQLSWVLEWMEQPGVTIQLTPLDDAHCPVWTHPTVIADHTEGRPCAYVEGHAGATLIYRAEQVDAMMKQFANLSAYALSPEASATVIRHLIW